MRSQLRKSTFREIRSSLGRFMAILAIIGLGVGFFAGLKVAKQAMVATVDDYLDRHDFYDYRILSTMGFQQESVDYLRDREDVAAAEGGLSFDVLYGVGPESAAEDGEGIATQGAIKAYSLPDQINLPELQSGRMPLGDHECVADSNRFSEADLGSVIVFTEENEEETLEHFVHRAYTIVGIVQSPLYLQYERGNTSLGSGRLDGFVYLPKEGFADDYYTEIYVALEGEHELYGEEYRALTEKLEPDWETYAETAADLRYQSIVSDAEKELADARKELADKKAEGEAELADAAAELEDAQKELEDGEQALADARQELEDGRRTLGEKETELEEAKRLVAEKEAQLEDGERALQEGIDSWNQSSNSLKAAKEQLNSNKSAVAQQKQSLETAMEGFRQLDEGIAAAQDLLDRTDAAILQADNGLKETESGLEQLQELKDSLSAEELEARKEELEQQEAQLTDQKTALEGQKNQLAEQRNTILLQQEDLQSRLAASESQRVQVQEGLQLVAQSEAQIADAEAQIADGDRNLASAWAQIENSRLEINNGRQELENAKAEISDGQADMEKARRELADAENTLTEKEEELADAQAQYDDGLKEYQDAQDKFDKETADAEKEIADAEEELNKLEAPEVYLLGRDTNVGYVCFENDSSIVEGIANIFPVFFILVAALVCVTTMNRMVEEQRTQIGVLKALGYGEGAIMSKYMIYSGLAALIGCAAGFLLGTWGFPKVIWAAYGIMYKAEDLLYVFDWRLAAAAVAVSLLCSVGTTWLSCRVELSQVAAQLMRPKAPKAGKRVFLEYVPLLWNRLSFLRKVSLRNIFRYKKRLFMMILGISGCTALLVTGFGIRDSITDIAKRQFGEIQIYDLGVTLKEPADAALEKELGGLDKDGVDSWLCVMEKNVDLVTENGVKSIILIAADPAELPKYIDLHTQDDTRIPYPARGEGVISDKLAAEYGVKVGDTILLRDENMREMRITVSAIQKNYIYNYVHISEDTWEDQMGERPEKKSVYINVDPQADVHAAAAALMQSDSVSNVTVNLDTMERVSSMMDSLNIIVVTVILCAAGLAFIVLYNLTNINITERIREIATIKVLGFYKKETAAYVFRENLILSVMGMALGLVLGKLLHGYVMNEIQIDMISFDVYVKPVSYVYSGILTIGFAWLVGRFMGGKLENISMTESLKSVD